MQAGEEMLRSKPLEDGTFDHNSYSSPDSVNSIKWELLDQKIYRNTVEYYKGLIAFRKAHPVLRLTSLYDVLSHVIAIDCEEPRMCIFHLSGDIPAEPADELLVIFNASEYDQTVELPGGKWHICINAYVSGTNAIESVESSVHIEPISAMVLVKGNLK